MQLDQINRQNEAFPNLCFTAAGVAEGTTANTWKTTNAIQGTIAGLNVTKAAADSQAFSAKKPGGAAVEAVPVGSHCFFTCQMNAAGTLTTVQGDINGGIPQPCYPDKKILLVATAAAPITLGIVGADILRFTKTSHGLNVGDQVRCEGLSQSAHGALNGVPLFVTRVTDANNFEVNLPTTQIPFFAAGAAYSSGASIQMVSCAQIVVGVIRVAPTSAAFTPASTDLSATGTNAVYWDTFGLPAFDRL